jgi:hypothetical protein
MSEAQENRDGVVYHAHCTCKAFRYGVVDQSIFLHCCSCCPQESGSALVLNAMT